MNEENQNIFNNGQNVGQPNSNNYPNQNGYINNNIGNATVTYPNNGPQPVNTQYNQMQQSVQPQSNPFGPQPVQSQPNSIPENNVTNTNNIFTSQLQNVQPSQPVNSYPSNNSNLTMDVNNQFSTFTPNDSVVAPQQTVNPVNIGGSNEELFNPMPKTQINPYPNTSQNVTNEPKRKNKKIFIIIIILLLVVLFVMGTFVIKNNNSKTTTKNTKQIEKTTTEDKKETKEKKETTEETTTEEADATKTKALEFIQSISNYVRISTSSSVAIQGYDKYVPIASTGNVVCVTEDGVLWTGIVADGSESCNSFMNAVVTKSNKEAPKEASITLEQSGTVLNNSWIKYDDKYCTYDGTQITTCTETKPN